MTDVLPPSTASRSNMGRSKSAVYSSQSTMTLPSIRGHTSLGMRGGLSATRKSRMRRTKSASAGIGSLGNTLPLPIGPAMSNLLRTTSPEVHERVRRQMERDSPLRTPEIHEKVRQRRRQERAMAAWVKAKEEQKEAEEAAVVELEGTKEQKFAKVQTKKAKGETAYISWLETKDTEEYEFRVREAVGPAFDKGFTLSDLRKVITKLCQDDTLFATMENFFAALSGPDMKSVEQDTVALLLTQASSGARVAAKIEEMEKDGGGEVLSKEAIANKRVQNKIGEQILAVLCSGRTIFGHAINTVRDVFIVADADGDGSLDKEEFKHVCDRLDLGMQTLQLQELWTAFDLDGDGTISGEEFEEMLIMVEANRVRNQANPQEIRDEVKAAEVVLSNLGERSAAKLVDQIFERATENRLDAAIAEGSEGKIGLLELKIALRKCTDESTTDLNPAQRSNLIRIFDQLFRKLDTKKSGKVALDDLLFFVRTAVMKMSQTTLNDAAHTKSRLLFKIGKTIIKSIRNNGAGQTNNLPSFEQVARMAKEIFISFDPHARGHLSRHSMMKAIKQLGFSLSMVQEDMLFTNLDADGNGQIDISEFSVFLKRAASRMAQEEQEKKDAEDPRSNVRLIALMSTTVSKDVSVLVPILLDVKHLFNRHGAGVSPKVKMSTVAKGVRHSVAQLSGVATNNDVSRPLPVISTTSGANLTQVARRVSTF